MSRGARWLTVAVALVGAVLLLGAVPVSAAPSHPQHPLGNFTVNHYDGLHLYADHIADTAVIDAAEIPTLQAKAAVDTDHDGTVSTAESAAYATRRCASLAAALDLRVGGTPARLAVQRAAFGYRPGAVGLQTSRLTCDLSAPARLSRPASVAFNDGFDAAGVGWHETTAVATGVALVGSPLPATSISDELRRYPNDLLASPLDVRGGTLSVRPDGGSSYSGGFHVSGTNVFSRALNHVNTTFNGLVGRQRLTLGVGSVALLLAMLLGAGHALLPGHGKTIMAAYLVGRRGRLRDVVAVGTTVTLTHTAGVLVLGLVISVSASFEPATAERWLGVGSGLMVVGVGLALLRSALRRRRAGESTGTLLLAEATAVAPTPALAGAVAAPAALVPHHHDQHDHHDHPHPPADAHGHPHPHAHPHPHPHGHSHGHPAATGGPLSRGSIVGLGVAGGLVPSPSALVVLLGTIALGRTAFGVLLVVAYGLGLALTLTLAGVLLVPLRNRAERLRIGARLGRSVRYLDALPVITAALVVGVGLLLAVRSLSLF